MPNPHPELATICRNLFYFGLVPILTFLPIGVVLLQRWQRRKRLRDCWRSSSRVR